MQLFAQTIEFQTRNVKTIKNMTNIKNEFQTINVKTKLLFEPTHVKKTKTCGFDYNFNRNYGCHNALI